MNFLYSMMITTTTMMMFMNHPLALGLLILMQTLMISVMIGILNKTYWFSYILILTFLGGMLILFIYMTSIASNEMFNLSSKVIMTTLMLLTITLIFLMKVKLNKNIINNNEMSNFMNNITLFNNNQSLSMMKLYNNQFMLMTMMLILYLLICLIAIIKIISNNQAPFRINM